MSRPKCGVRAVVRWLLRAIHGGELRLRRIRELVGTEIESVVFVRDYLQLVGDRAGLTFYQPPVAEVEERRVPFADHGFADVARRLVGTRIVEASADGPAGGTFLVVIMFSNGTAFLVEPPAGVPERLAIHWADGTVDVES